jgi:hypothetical protein
MEIIIGILFVVFMFLVDWRLSGIHNELKKMNKPAASKMAVGNLFPGQVTEQTETDEAAMAKHGIKFDGKQYVFREYGYDKLADAIAYAKKKAT